MFPSIHNLNWHLVFVVAASLAGCQSLCGTAAAQDDAAFSSQQLEFFENQVRPLLVHHCYDCHGPDADPPEGGLSLASRTSILQGGDSGRAIDLDEPDESLLISAVEYGDLFQMPPDSKLDNAHIEVLRRWVREGAPWPSESDATVASDSKFDLEQRRSEHWCWQPINRSGIPKVSMESWPIDPLDRFVLAKLEENGFAPGEPADRRTWLRRVTFDLTGLPPTPGEIEAFVSDDSPGAFETVVDRLLASPHYGERWARHWMDLIRFAETCGHEFDYPIPNAYQYRDWLIRAFNADVPYDQFIVEQIAGDLVDPPRRNPENQINESILGTGFWFLGEATHGPVDVKGDEAGRIDNQIDVMTKTFLGLTVACARCHDHKFDAISTEDYYALSGFLQSSRRQDVMLDPHGTIEAAWNEAGEIAAETSRAVERLISQLKPENIDYDEISRYIEAAVLFLQQNRQFLIPPEIRLEGETLKPFAVNGGKAERQDLPGWSGGAQLWWRDGNPGDSIEFELEVPAAGKYEIATEFTHAPDYGIVRTGINGTPVGEPVDLYAEHVSRTGEISFGLHDLDAGTVLFKLELTGKNDQAAAGYMAGIDWIELRVKGSNEFDEEVMATLDELVDQYELDAAQFRNWIEAIRQASQDDISHPFRMLHQIAASNAVLTSSEGEEAVANVFAENKILVDKSRAAWTQLAKCVEGNWSTSGSAFVQARDFRGVDFSGPAPQPYRPGSGDQWHSGLRGSSFAGVLRSPTFEIVSPDIFYLVTARKAKIRVVIDGFRLDEYNPLLFEGLTIDVDTGGKPAWIRLSGDLRNYIGHRAHIEVIDPGEGYIVLDFCGVLRESQQESNGQFDSAIAPWFNTDAAVLRWKRPRHDRPGTPLEFTADSITDAVFSGLSGAHNGFRDDQLLDLIITYRLITDLNYDQLLDAMDIAQAEMAKINDHLPDPVLAIGMNEGTPEDEYVFVRGNHKNLGDLAPRRPPAALPRTSEWDHVSLSGSGRLELARHIADPVNPLTARVAVNRVWHHLTGRGIVRSVDNFGVMGERPSHPELLDYLATEFADGGWSIKRLIRRIVLSQTYRMSGRADKEAVEADPDNVLLHHFRTRRLQGEAIRDAMLAVSGELATTMYGPSVPIHLTDFMQGRGRPEKSGPLDGDRRRSVYLEVRRNFLSPMMLAFDTPIPFNTIGRRTQSNVPAQALILMNDPFIVDQARKWAERLIVEHSEPDARIDAMMLAALGRTATDDEKVQMLEFVEQQAENCDLEPEMAAGDLDCWSDLCHVVFNMKEFIFLD